jgi:hypothetical protein
VDGAFLYPQAPFWREKAFASLLRLLMMFAKIYFYHKNKTRLKYLA